MKKVIIILFALISINVLGLKNHKVLVLHSYHQGLTWTDKINSGIKSEMDKEKDIEVFYEYLDTKRHFNSKFIKETLDLHKLKMKADEFDVIIASDNNALDFIIENKENVYKDTPVIFCGINNFDNKMLKGYKNFAGIKEEADHKSTIEVILQIHDNLEKILILNDKTPTGIRVKEELFEILDYFNYKIDIEYVDSFTKKSLIEKLNKLNKNTIIYLLTLNRDDKGEYFSFKEAINLVKSNTKVPVYGSWDFYLGDGIVGGMITSGFNQGKYAAIKAKELINGKSIEEIGIEGSEVNRYIFDYKELENYGISKKLLPESSLIINKPEKIIEKYINIFITMFFSMAIILVIMEIRYIQRMRKEEKLKNKFKKREFELLKKNEELEKVSAKNIYGFYNKNFFNELLNHTLMLNQKKCNPDIICKIEIELICSDEKTDQIKNILTEIVNTFLKDGDFVGEIEEKKLQIIISLKSYSEGELIAKKIEKEIEKYKNEEIKVKTKLSLVNGYLEINLSQ